MKVSIIPPSRRAWISVVSALILSLAISSCTPQLYDLQTETSITDLQRATDQFLVELERNPQRPECLYTQHEAFYETTQVELSAVQVRNRARTRNELTSRQLGFLADSYAALEELHKTSACIGAAQIEPLRRNFNTTFTAILTLELAKKRGE